MKINFYFLYFQNKIQFLADVPEIKFFKCDSRAYIPVRATPGSAGLDLFCMQNTVLEPFQRNAIKTGLKVELPIGTYGRIASRSGLSLHHGINVRGGVIDPDYRGEIIVILFNDSRTAYYLSSGERMAQLIVEKYLICRPKLCLSLEEPSPTIRGDNGFGSTDHKHFI